MKTVKAAAVVLAALLGAQGLASADSVDIVGSGGLNGLGFFEGTFKYTATGSASGTVEIYLKNTSPAANGGDITAFVFNLPVAVTVGTFTTTNSFFNLLSLTNGVKGEPFGMFDIGAALGTNPNNAFEGGGAPGNGIDVGQDAKFTFDLSGNASLATLTAADFLSTLSTGGGEGAEGLVVRFKGFDNRGSDKVPAKAVPEPGTLALLGLGVMGLVARRARAKA